MKHLVVRSESELIAKFPVSEKGGTTVKITAAAGSKDYFLLSFGDSGAFFFQNSFLKLSIEESKNGEVTTK